MTCVKGSIQQNLPSSNDSFVYSGELEVLGGDFILDADRLVIKDGEVAFTLSGIDVHGKFRATGSAIQTNNECFVCKQIKVDYQGFVFKDEATIRFDLVMPTEKKHRCHVEGKWVQGDTWLFSGNLRRYKATK